MLGGARIVRFVVLQESKITASATAPPTPHNKLSRLPWIHRVSLDRHTNGEYAQKQKTLTTHFFRFFLTQLRILWMLANLMFRLTELRWRFSTQSFEDAIKLRKRLKSYSERDLTDPKIAAV